ncbi:sugar ABC transporter permease [Clostridium sp. KNHs205]|jgi:oligogalacturonide transport system permease protein|uniref:carbohydrate ABC transporter permease n=1 Tax=Clostridium sp. KNHs205 TaxID=1449050 RepID=UPI00051B8368|nr:sugar ABC transporter permease [Clostridium sp. KNHs205]
MKKNRKSKLKRRESLMGYVFVAPWMLGALVFLIVPLIQSFYYSLQNVKITPKGRVFQFIKFQNYTDIFRLDPLFLEDLTGYLLDTLLSVPVIVVFSLIIAMLLNGKMKGKGLFRTIYFLPVIVVSGPVMAQLADQGAASIPAMNVTAITSILGDLLPNFLVEPIAGLFNNMIMVLWYSGVQILIFLAAIQKIDSTLYEAAKIDGGSGWECFWKITLPTIKPMILLNAVYTVIFLSNNEQNVIITSIYNDMFAINRGYGFASAKAWVYSLVVCLLVIFIALLLRNKKDNYITEVKKEKKRLQKLEKERRQLRNRQARRRKGLKREGSN